MSKPTPGPWKRKIKSVLIPIAPYEWAEAYGGSIANARLIAAAPDLLEALKRMASIIDKMGDMPDGFIHPSPWQTLKCEEALTQAHAAIAKAEGEKR